MHLPILDARMGWAKYGLQARCGPLTGWIQPVAVPVVLHMGLSPTQSFWGSLHHVSASLGPGQHAAFGKVVPSAAVPGQIVLCSLPL